MGISTVIIGATAGQLPERLGASVYSSAAQLIPSGAFTSMNWDTERYDNGGYFDPAAPTRLTVPAGAGGLYVVRGIYPTLAHAPSVPYLVGVTIVINGLTFTGLIWADLNIAIEHGYLTAIEEELNDGDYVELRVFQGAAVGVNTIPGLARGRFELARVPSQ
jgi:hypothetical protein